ncbi:hypothetical protein J1614_005093 [Plenodomus biglobosus]|nr:hypothetical protein J1614_005093 [Plenodomus biglobosus]
MPMPRATVGYGRVGKVCILGQCVMAWRTRPTWEVGGGRWVQAIDRPEPGKSGSAAQSRVEAAFRELDIDCRSVASAGRVDARSTDQDLARPRDKGGSTPCTTSVA